MSKSQKLMYGHGIDDCSTPKSWKENGQTIKCPFYTKWRDMIKRCYSQSWHSLYPTYIGCTVCEEWLTFSNFKAWMETQDWENKQLDKDFLSESRIYSPDTCLFVSRELNVFLTLSGKSRGDLPLGVGLSQSKGKQYRAHIYGKNLGTYETVLEAHQAWQRAKLEKAIYFQSTETDIRAQDGLQRVINLITEDIHHNRITTHL